MVKLYVKKITSGAINPNTGEAWRLEDVPPMWYEKVKEMLENKEEKPEIPETPVEDEENESTDEVEEEETPVEDKKKK